MDHLILTKILKIKIQKFNKFNCNPLYIPMQLAVRLNKEDCPNPNTLKDTTSPYHYSQIINNLMHVIVNSKPNYAYVMNNLTQYLTNPSLSHIQNLKRVL
jgi:hypothetical protein